MIFKVTNCRLDFSPNIHVADLDSAKAQRLLKTERRVCAFEKLYNSLYTVYVCDSLD